MSQDRNRLERAIKRTFAEVNNAKLELVAYNAMCSAEIRDVGVSFFFIAHLALYNDMIAHIAKILDKHRNAASFWYICDFNNSAKVRVLSRTSVDLQKLEVISSKIKLIRDKTHFHIDREYVLDPSEAWKEANVTGDEIIYVLDSVLAVISEINLELCGGEKLVIPKYDGSDVKRIADAYYKSK